MLLLRSSRGAADGAFRYRQPTLVFVGIWYAPPSEQPRSSRRCIPVPTANACFCWNLVCSSFGAAEEQPTVHSGTDSQRLFLLEFGMLLLRSSRGAADGAFRYR